MTHPVLIVGSHALHYYTRGAFTRPGGFPDMDIITTFGGLRALQKSLKPSKVLYMSGHKVAMWCGKLILEVEIAYANTAAYDILTNCMFDQVSTYHSLPNGDAVHFGGDVDVYMASLNFLYTLKMSHRYLKDTPHFKKTRDDIMLLRALGAQIYDTDWLKRREDEAYRYKHPTLNKDKGSFFSGDGVRYVYDHDKLHEVVAVGIAPAYTYYQVDGEEVLSSKEKFFDNTMQNRIRGVYEEACVLALERAVIPHNTDPEKAFVMALEKVCTSITSGWFREFAWENYDAVVELYYRRNKIDRNYYQVFDAWRKCHYG